LPGFREFSSQFHEGCEQDAKASVRLEKPNHVAPLQQRGASEDKKMKRWSGFATVAVAAAAVSLVTLSPAMAQHVRYAQGQAYWSGDPGPIDPGSFWEGGQYKYDPNHYLSYYGREPQDFLPVVYARHSGPRGCVWRKRVVNSNWEFHHPYIKVCD
jgi:hypothetical protein